MSTYFETEARLQEALNYKREHPNSSFRWLARQFNLSKDRIQRRFKGTQTSRSARDPTNLKLDTHQDKALCWYLTRLWEIGVPLRYKGIAAAANEILATAYNPVFDSPPPTVGENWSRRWIKRHPEFSKRLEKPIEAERQCAMNAESISEFFNKFNTICITHEITKEDIWNMDETGLRVGVGRGQWVIVPTNQVDSRFKNLIGSLGDTEHVSVVEAISAGCATIAPLIIIKGVIIQTRWFHDLKEGDIAIGVSDSGYSNDILSFQWLQHFNRLSKRTQQGIYRLLIMDGYDSHLTIQFVRYCEMEKILVLRLPPHSTHFLQPLDVVIFQQWKHWHAEAIDHAVRHGVGDFDKQTFLSNIESIRQATFKEGSIKSAFRKCGFVPFRPNLVIREIELNLEKEAGIDKEITLPQSPAQLPEIWSSPTSHNKLYQQAQAVQQLLRSSVEPPDTPTRQNNRANVRKFMELVLTQDIVHQQLTNYMWESRVAQIQQERRKNKPRSQIQKGGVVYAADVDRDISCLQELIATWETNLNRDQMVYLLCLRSLVLPQLILQTKKRKEAVDRDATNCLKRATRRLKKESKKEGTSQQDADFIDID
jgi:hypothetical protein